MPDLTPEFLHQQHESLLKQKEALISQLNGVVGAISLTEFLITKSEAVAEVPAAEVEKEPADVPDAAAVV